MSKELLVALAVPLIGAFVLLAKAVLDHCLSGRRRQRDERDSARRRRRDERDSAISEVRSSIGEAHKATARLLTLRKDAAKAKEHGAAWAKINKLADCAQRVKLCFPTRVNQKIEDIKGDFVVIATDFNHHFGTSQWQVICADLILLLEQVVFKKIPLLDDEFQRMREESWRA